MTTISNALRTPKIALILPLVVSIIPLFWGPVAAGASLTLGAWDPAPTVEPALTPSVEVDPIIDDVAFWLGPDVNSAGFGAAFRDRAESFELFAAFHSDPDRHEVIAAIPFGSDITTAATRHGLDPFLVAAVVEVESSFQPKAGSHKGAVGLMQLLPSTAGMPAARLFDPRTNLDAGSQYLSGLIERFEGDLELALAAYNAGPTNVRRFGGVPPFPETEQYVEKVLGQYLEHHRNAWLQAESTELIAETLGTPGLVRS